MTSTSIVPVHTSLPQLMARTQAAREAFEARRLRVQVVIEGRGMIRLVDSTSGAVLGFRARYHDALAYARRLEEGSR